MKSIGQKAEDELGWKIKDMPKFDMKYSLYNIFNYETSVSDYA
jgi:hypothetical protein